MSFIPNTGNSISAANSTASLLLAGATFTGAWEDVTNYTTVSTAVLGSLATDGTLYFDLSTDGGTTSTSVPQMIGDATFAVPRILNVVETHVRIRYVNGTTAQTGTFSLQTKYSNGQDMTLLSPLDGFIDSENPATLVRPGTEFDLDVARQHIGGQRSFFFFGFNPDVSNGGATIWEDIHPAGGDINWLTTASTVEVLSSDAADTSAGLGVRSVEIHGLSATGVDQDEVIIMNGVTPVVSALTYIRINKMHSETCGTYGGSHQGDITCQVSGGGVLLSKMVGEEGAVDTSVQYGLGEANNGYWSVPLGKVMYITRLTVIPDVATNKNVTVHLYERDDLLDTTTPFTPRRILWSEDAIEGPIAKEFKSHIKIKSLADIWFRAKASAASSIQVTLDFYLVDADANGQ